MALSTTSLVLLVVLLVLLLGAVPGWGDVDLWRDWPLGALGAIRSC